MQDKLKTKCDLIKDLKSLRRKVIYFEKKQKQLIVGYKQTETELKASHERLKSVFENAADGILIADIENKKFFFCNHTICQMLGYSENEIYSLAVMQIHPEEDLPYVIDQFERQRNKEFTLAKNIPVKRKDGSIFHADVNSFPLILEGRECLAGFFRDVTERKQAEEVQNRLNRELRAIRNCNQTLLRVFDEQTLLNEICRIICEEAGYRLAWVGYAENDSAKTIRPVAWAGFDSGYIANARLSWAGDTERGQGPAGKVVRSCQLVYVQDFETDPLITPWRESALKHGYRSGIALPLKDEAANVFGVLLIYSAEPNAITTEEIRLLEELSGDLAFGIVTLRTRAERKKIEEALCDNEERYRKAQVIGHVGSWEYNLQTTEFWGSNEAKRIYGFDINTVHFSTDEIENCIPEREKVHQALIDLIEKNKEYNLEFDIITQDKKERKTIISIAELERDENGNPIKITGFIQDVTKRKQAENALNRKEQEYRTLVDNIPDLIVRYDKELKRIYVNPAWEKKSGLKAEEVLNIQAENIPKVPFPAVPEYTEKLSYVFETGIPQTIGFNWTNVYNEELYLEYSIVPEYDKDGKTIGILAVGRDLTERKRADEEIRKSEIALREAQQLGRLGSWDWDAKTDKIIWSQEYYHIYGFDPSQPPPGYGEHLKAYTPESAAKLDTAVRKNMKTGEPYVLDLELARKDGPSHWITARSETKYDKDGKIVGLRGTAQDITERKRAEMEILRSNDLLRAIIEAAPTAIFDLDLDGNVKAIWNPAAERILGWTSKEVIGHPLPTVPIENQEEFKIFREQIRSGKTLDGIEVHRQRRDGTPIDYCIYASPLLDSEGGITGNVAVLMDITERNRAEKIIFDSEKRFKDLANLLPQTIFESDINGIITFANETALTTFGYSLNDLAKGYNIINMISDKDKTSATENLQRILKDLPVTKNEYEMVRKNGTIFPALTFTAPIIREGKTIGLRGTIVDITQRKQIENELRKLSEAVEQSPASILITNLDAKIEYANKTFEEITGYSLDEIRNLNPRILKSGHTTKDEYRMLWDTISSGHTWHGEFLNKKKNGEFYWEEALITPIKNKENKILNYLAVKKDITEKKRITEELIKAKELAEKSDKLKTEFLSQMSHEIRTPLNVILGLTNIIEEGIENKLTPEYLKYFDGINSASQRLIRTIDLVLNASEMQLGTYEPSFTSFDLIQEVIEKVKLDYTKLIKDKGLKVNFVSEVPSAVVVGDKYSIYQIFVNLTDNAIKFTKEGSISIMVEKNENKKEIKVIIEDTGIGMSEEFMSHMYEPFMQEERGYSRRFEGNGLGLSLVKKYCELNGIIIEVESKKEIGAKFTLTFIDKAGKKEYTRS